jgi:uncharacterized membrane protein YwzB
VPTAASTAQVASLAPMIAADGFIFILTFLVGTYFAWRALGILKWDQFIFDPIGQQARILRFFLAMFGGLIVGMVAVMYLIAGQAMSVLL